MRVSLIVAALGLVVSPIAQGADGTSNANRLAQSSVQGVLAQERAGRDVDRDKRLKSAVRRSPDFAPARWQSGQVRSGEAWVDFDRLVRTMQDDATLTEYRRLRDAEPNTVDGHLRLAGWCAKHGLPRQRRAHLTAVLEREPNHAAARSALGYVRVGGTWMTRSRMKQNRRRAEQAARDLQRWGPGLAEIRDGFLSGDRTRARNARQRLWRIADPAAVPAVELAIGYRSPALAAVVVEYLGNLRHQEATIALARQAVFSPWKSIRQAAAGKLKTRKLEHFVPQVLLLTSQPIRSRRLLYVDARGTLLYRHVYFQEDRNARKLTVVDHRHRSVGAHAAGNLSFPVRPGEPTAEVTALNGLLRTASREASMFSGARARNDNARLVRELVQSRQRIAEQANRLQAQVNSRVRDLLHAVTGRKFDGDARQLWNWWDAYSEVWNPGVKPLYARRLQSASVSVVPSYSLGASAYDPTPPPPGSRSCLAAGTPVWTDRGLVAIEKVRIGDCVLSQNVDSGELACKPVLKTTVRPAVPLLKLDVGPRTIHVTGGHPFWIAGKGWMKARQITGGMRMHDVTGTTAVRPAGKAKAEPTYNLIVADFHTYFVGEAKVLSHDNTSIAPTDALVPGLTSR